MGFHRREIREEEVELWDGSTITIPILEIPAKEMDDLIHLTTKIAVKTLQEDQGESPEFDGDFEKMIYKLQEAETIKAYNKGILKSESIWRIMTGQEDVSWIHNCPPSVLEDLNEIFIEINRPLKGAKKNMDIAEKVTEILSDPMALKVFSSIWEKNSEDPLTNFMKDTVIDKSEESLIK